MNTGPYVPRAGTRARAVFDLLQDGQEHRWKETFEAYRLAVHPYSNPHYVSLTLGRLLKRIATRVRKGVYVRRLMEKNPCAEIPPAPPQTGSPEIEDMAWGSVRAMQAEQEHDCSGCHDGCLNREKQLTEVADRYQEDNIELRRELEEARALLNKTEVHLIRAGEALEEAKSQHQVMEEQIRARDQVIKNQLGWVERLETRISNAKRLLEG